MYHVAQKNGGKYRSKHLPLWLSLIPPLLAIILALLTREVIVSLFAGVWSGAFIAGGLRVDSFYYSLLSIWDTVSIYIKDALADGSHVSIIVFSLLIGAMVAVISRNGGMAGVVQGLSRFAKTPRSTQFVTWLLGVAIFFDDYANTLIVGNTMRSATDRFRISREKLAYIVDSTAAPVSAIAFITTWIGAELGYIEGAIATLEGFDQSISAYGIFVQSLQYSFYPILTLLFILILVFTKRDFGTMLKAERRARETGVVRKPRSDDDKVESTEDLSPVKGAKLRWYNAALPVLTVVGLTIFGLVDTGLENTAASLSDAGFTEQVAQGKTWASAPLLALDGASQELLQASSAEGLSADAAALLKGGSLAAAQAATQASLSQVSFTQKLGILIGNSDSYIALLWASLSGVLVAIFLTLIGRIMSLNDTMDTVMVGFKSMLPALVILTMAWALAALTGELHTAEFLTSAMNGAISPYWLPPLTFIVAAAIAFSTGSSWSTMAILYPIAIPATWIISNQAGLDPETSMSLMLNSIAVVLAASVLGDHCSPISDTTILSSLASDCDHIDHVRTQMPYALLVGVVSLVLCFVSTRFGVPFFVSLLVGLAVLVGAVFAFGKVVEDGPQPPAE